jgi:hypothetical protein
MSFCLILVCSCVTRNSHPPDLPPETTFNSGAGRGDWLFVPLHLQDGKELLFAVDTGMPVTILDKSLEPLLGKCVGTHRRNYMSFSSSMADTYKAPKIYLGKTRLKTWKWVVTEDINRLQVIPSREIPNYHPDRRVSGILGIDCLQNYCIQLDFVAHKIRFLDPERLDTNDLGDAFPLTYGIARFYFEDNLAGIKGTPSSIDTGDPNDGMLVSELFNHLLLQKGVKMVQFKLPNGQPGIAAQIPIGQFERETYTNLLVMKDNELTSVGLRFLARHLVTFNFPEQMVYLKQISEGPLMADPVSTNASTSSAH